MLCNDIPQKWRKRTKSYESYLETESPKIEDFEGTVKAARRLQVSKAPKELSGNGAKAVALTKRGARL